MTWTTKAFMDRLLSDSELTSQLAVTNSGRPAIFGYEDIPETDTPYVVTAGEVSNVPTNFKGTIVRKIVRQIRCYGVTKDGPIKIEQIADRIEALFSPTKLAAGELMFPNVSVNLIDCAPSQHIAPTDATMNGRVIAVSILAEDLV